MALEFSDGACVAVVPRTGAQGSSESGGIAVADLETVIARVGGAVVFVRPTKSARVGDRGVVAVIHAERFVADVQTALGIIRDCEYDDFTAAAS